MDDLHHLLGGGDRSEDLVPDRLVLHAVDEAANDLEVDVGFQQRHPDLPERLLDVVLREPTPAAQTVEHGLQSRAEGVEHEH